MCSEKCSDKYQSERLIQELLSCQREKEDCETVIGWRELLEISKSVLHMALRTDFECCVLVSSASFHPWCIVLDLYSFLLHYLVKQITTSGYC